MWNERHALALSSGTCAGCNGSGFRTGDVCYCVWRKVFRICYERFKVIAGDNKSLEHVSKALDGNWPTPDRDCPQGENMSYPDIDFTCDFVLIARRALPCPLDWELFRLSFLLGADHKFCARKMKIERGDFFHRKYQVEERLGHAYAHTLPYPLYPLDDYFTTEQNGIPYGARHEAGLKAPPATQQLYTITRRVLNEDRPVLRMAA
jgi:hypothetical protein